MNDHEKVMEYEIEIASMLHAIQERLDELADRPLDDFDKGRQLAFIEMLDIIQTRHNIIMEIVQDNT